MTGITSTGHVSFSKLYCHYVLELTHVKISQKVPPWPQYIAWTKINLLLVCIISVINLQSHRFTKSQCARGLVGLFRGEIKESLGNNGQFKL